MTTHMNYRKEHLIYTSIWLMLYLSPLASLYAYVVKSQHRFFMA